jgi:tRNA (cytidine/uridine-2'-O-)-methyltransferase
MTSQQPAISGWIEIALVHPEIPPNTGNVMRLCANVGANLHLIEPLGFAMDERRLRRAGMDYRDLSRVQRHDDLERFSAAYSGRRWVALTTRAERPYDDWQYQPGDVLLFGAETRGLPQALLDTLPPSQRLLIPQMPDARSLNLSNAVAVVVYEAWRQQGFRGAGKDESPQRRGDHRGKDSD